MNRQFIILAGLLALAISHPAFAGEEGHHSGSHGSTHGDMHQGKEHAADSGHHDNAAEMKEGAFLQKKDIDGYTVTFHVMKAPEGMAKGGTHHLMVKVEKDNTVVEKLTVNSKVTHPNDKPESKMMMKMGNWYMVGYDLGHPGKHQVMVLFKTEDDKKHFGGVVYSEK